MEDKDSQTGLAISRIEFLSDGIFAIAMTLLVLDLKVPRIPPDLVHVELLSKLLVLWPKVFGYITGFLILGVGWVGQHTSLHYVKRSDRIFLWLNILYLMGVAFVPFSTALMGSYGKERLAIFIFGTNLLIITIFLYCVWWYATYNYRLVDRDLNPVVIKLVKQRLMGAVVMYFVTVGVSFFSTDLSRILFLVGPLSFVRPSRLDRYFK